MYSMCVQMYICRYKKTAEHLVTKLLKSTVKKNCESCYTYSKLCAENIQQSVRLSSFELAAEILLNYICRSY
jgi:hypothetical protein